MYGRDAHLFRVISGSGWDIFTAEGGKTLKEYFTYEESTTRGKKNICMNGKMHI